MRPHCVARAQSGGVLKHAVVLGHWWRGFEFAGCVADRSCSCKSCWPPEQAPLFRGWVLFAPTILAYYTWQLLAVGWKQQLLAGLMDDARSMRQSLGAVFVMGVEAEHAC